MEWTAEQFPNETGDYLATIYSDAGWGNFVIACRWDNEHHEFVWNETVITDYVIAWMKFPEAYDETHNPINSTDEFAWVSQHL